MSLRCERDFDAFSGLGMDRVAVEEFEFFGRRRSPGFDEAAVACVDAEGALRAEDLDRKGVEEFVGEDDKRNLRG